MTDCGSKQESCCASSSVTGGMYDRTYSNDGSGPMGEADAATVSSFDLDTYLVTVGRFRKFVLAWGNGTGWLPSAGEGKHSHLNGGQGLVDGADSDDAGTVYETGWDAADWNSTTYVDPTDANLGSCGMYSTWTSAAGKQEDLPINCVNWYEAYAFCIWDGGFLPSEAEWEYAAAGGSKELEFPWGSTAPGTSCPGTGCSYAIFNCNYPSGASMNCQPTCSGVSNIAPVGTASMGAGTFGQLDMAGELNEWNLDWYQPLYIDPCTDCADLSPASDRAVRGSNFYYDSTYLSPTYRAGENPTARDGSVGFRCGRAS